MQPTVAAQLRGGLPQAQRGKHCKTAGDARPRATLEARSGPDQKNAIATSAAHISTRAGPATTLASVRSTAFNG